MKKPNFKWDTERDMKQGIEVENNTIKQILKLINKEEDEDEESIIRFKRIIINKIRKGI